MADTPDLPAMPTPDWWADMYGTGHHGRRGIWKEQQRRHSSGSEFFAVFEWETVQAYAREAVRLAARASVPAGWKLVPVKATTAQRLAMAGADDESGDRYRLMAAAMLAASPAAPTPPDEASDALDAARYRWLRDKSVPPHNFYISVPVEFEGVRYTPAEVDAGIDAARSTAA